MLFVRSTRKSGLTYQLIVISMAWLMASSAHGELFGVSQCGSACQQNLQSLGSYFANSVPDKGATLSVLSIGSEPFHSCIKQHVVNNGEWARFGENWPGFRAYLTSLVQVKCVEPMLNHTRLVIQDVWLEKEQFFSPTENQTYGLSPQLIPVGSYLDQVWLSVAVVKLSEG